MTAMVYMDAKILLLQMKVYTAASRAIMQGEICKTWRGYF